MNWKALLQNEIETTYGITAKLMDSVESDQLKWKPSTGSNWMTIGQLLMHLTNACGSSCKGFVTGDWGIPEEVNMEEMTPEEMLPPAEKMQTIASIDEAKALLAEDKKVALEVLEACSEEDLSNKIATAPWDPTGLVLGHRLLQMVDHLKQHKGQLFYYLKLQGKSVHTGNLWGM